MTVGLRIRCGDWVMAALTRATRRSRRRSFIILCESNGIKQAVEIDVFKECTVALKVRAGLELADKIFNSKGGICFAVNDKVVTEPNGNRLGVDGDAVNHDDAAFCREMAALNPCALVAIIGKMPLHAYFSSFVKKDELARDVLHCANPLKGDVAEQDVGHAQQVLHVCGYPNTV